MSVLFDGMFRKVRHIVSGKKIRHQTEDGFDLDLTYITDRVIAMGLPAEGVEALYRNSLPEVVRFLETRHPGGYLILNLCSERVYEREKFGGQVMHFGFPDHHAPSLEMLFTMCKTMDEWLRKSRDNVILVHCKAGKGRTGTVVASYLLYSGLCVGATSAMALFGTQRSRNGSGVTNPCQVRMVEYFDTILYERRRLHTAPVRLKKITFAPLPTESAEETCSLYAEVIQYLSNPEVKHTTRINVAIPGEGRLELPIDCILQNDVLIRVFKSSGKMLFRMQFHTAFVGMGDITFRRDNLDEIKKGVYPDFAMTLQLAPVIDPPPPDPAPNWPWSYEPPSRRHGGTCYNPATFSAEELLAVAANAAQDPDMPAEAAKKVLELQAKSRATRYLVELTSESAFRRVTHHTSPVTHVVTLWHDTITTWRDKVVTADSSGLIVIWRLSDGLEIARIPDAHEGRITGLCLASEFLFTSGYDGRVRYWSVEGTLAGELPIQPRQVPDGSELPQRDPITALYVNPNLLSDPRVFFGCESGHMAFCAKSASSLKQTQIPFHHERVNAIIVADNFVYSASDDCTVHASTLTHPVRVFQHAAAVVSLAYEEKVLYTGCRDGRAYAWHAGLDNQRLRVFDLSVPTDLSILLIDNVLLTGSSDGIRAWHVPSHPKDCVGELLAPDEASVGPMFVLPLQESHLLGVTLGNDVCLYEIDTMAGEGAPPINPFLPQYPSRRLPWNGPGTVSAAARATSLSVSSLPPPAAEPPATPNSKRNSQNLNGSFSSLNLSNPFTNRRSASQADLAAAALAVEQAIASGGSIPPATGAAATPERPKSMGPGQMDAVMSALEAPAPSKADKRKSVA